MNKKASARDLIVLMLVCVVFFTFMIFSNKLMDSFNTHIQADSAMPAESKAASTSVLNVYSGVLDKSFLFLTIGVGLAALILASLVRISPVFFPFYLLALIITVVLSGIFKEYYLTLAADPALTTLVASLTFTNLIMSYLPLFVGVIGTILAIVMYKQWANAQ